jgi:hypothetical protein
MIQQEYENSLYYKKKKEREGKLPFTRRINKGLNKIDKSMVSTIVPYTGEPPENPYMNISLDRPNERMRRNLENMQKNQETPSPEYANNALQDLRAKRVKSKRSHKLGLSKDNIPHNQSYQEQHAKDLVQNSQDAGYNTKKLTSSRKVSHKSPDQASKRETRLRDFYARSQRKQDNGSKLMGLREHNLSQDIRTPQKSPALDIMNLSTQLDMRNKERHMARHFDIGHQPSNFGGSNAFSMQREQQRSVEKLPTMVQRHQSLSQRSPEHLRNKSHVQPDQKSLEKEVTRSKFFGANSNDFNLNNIKINPITGVLSPLQQRKGTVY